VGAVSAAPYNFSITGLTAGTHTLKAVAEDNDGAISETTVSISVTDQTVVSGLNGPICAEPNSSALFYLDTESTANANSYRWWSTGSVNSITTNSSEANVNFSGSFNGGDICVAVNYSAAPWYNEYCITVETCGVATPASGAVSVFPNPTTSEFTVSATEALTNLMVKDCNGQQVYSSGYVFSGQNLTFGINWSAGNYYLTYTNAAGQVISETLIKQ